AVAALAAVVTAAAGCSSHLSTAELEASNRSAALEIVRSARPGTPDGGAVGPAGAGATAESGGAAPASPGGSAAVPEGPAAGGSSGTGAAVALRAGGTTAPVTGAAGSGGAGAGPAGRATSGARNGAGPNGGGPNGAGANGAGANGAGPNGGGANGAGPGGTAGALPGGGVAGAAPREVVLGSVGTGSGPIGANVASIPVAVRAWAATVNGRGGLAGHPVRVVFGDDGGDPGKALSLARRMVVKATILSSSTMRRVISYATDRGVPIVGGPSADPDEDSSPIVYNPQAGDRAAGQAIVTTVAAQTAAKKVSIFYCREVQSCSVNHQAAVDWATRHGLQVVHEAQVSLAQPDFTAEIVSARRADAEAVVALVDLQSMIRIVRSAERQGWKPIFGGSFAFDTVDAEQAA